MYNITLALAQNTAMVQNKTFISMLHYYIKPGAMTYATVINTDSRTASNWCGAEHTVVGV